MGFGLFAFVVGGHGFCGWGCIMGVRLILYFLIWVSAFEVLVLHWLV